VEKIIGIFGLNRGRLLRKVVGINFEFNLGAAMKNSWMWVGLGVVAGLFAGSAGAQDWPQWRGTDRDAKVTGFTAPSTWPKQFTQKWKVSVGIGDTTPALVGDKLYVLSRVGAEEVISCLNIADGKPIWSDKYATPAVSGASAREHSGPRSTPAVVDGKVVTLGVTGVASCLDASTGKVIWRKDEFPGAWPQFYTSYSPIVADGKAIFLLGGGAKSAAVAYDLEKGDVKWKTDGVAPAYASGSLLMVDGVKQIAVMADADVVGIGVVDGKVLWKVSFPVAGRAYNAATPMVTDGQTVIITGQGRGTQAVRIEKQGDGFTAKPLWKNAQVGTAFNTPVIKDGFIYGLSDRNQLFCLDLKTGETKWTDTTNRGSNYGTLVDAGSVIFAQAQNGNLAVFAPDSSAFKEAANVKVAEKSVFSYPIISGKKVIVRDVDSVTLWTIE
jgi:outer membrane protein assembly factor BamB